MATSTYPGAIEVLDADHTDEPNRLVGQDVDKLAADMNAVKSTLGVNPQGGSATVASRFATIGGGGGGSSPFVNLGDAAYAANGNGTFDNATALTNAFAALSPGGTLLIPPGDFYSSIGFEFVKPVNIKGMASGFNDHNYTDGKFVSKLSFASLGVPALKFSGNASLGKAAMSSVEDVVLRGSGGKSSGTYLVPPNFPPQPAAGHGVMITAQMCSMKKVYIEGFSGHGVYLESYTNALGALNANFCNFIDVSSKYNGRNGWHIVGINSNVCSLISCDGSWNRGYGIFNGADLSNTAQDSTNHAANNRFIGCHVEANKTGAAYDNSDGSYWEGLYAEGGYANVISYFNEGLLTEATEEFTIGSFSANGRYYGTNFTAIRIKKLAAHSFIVDDTTGGANPAGYPGYRWHIINPQPHSLSSAPTTPADAGTTLVAHGLSDSAKLAAIYDHLVNTHQIRRS